MKGTFFSYFSYRQLHVFRCRFAFTCSWRQHYPPFSPNVCLWEVGRRKGLLTRLLENMDVCLCAQLCKWVHVCMCICVDSWMFACVCVCVCALMFMCLPVWKCGSAFMRACIGLFVDAYLLTRVSVCMRVHACVRACNDREHFSQIRSRSSSEISPLRGRSLMIRDGLSCQH